jgi:hypothetical protein
MDWLDNANNTPAKTSLAIEEITNETSQETTQKASSE